VAQELRAALVLAAAWVASSTALDVVPRAALGKAALESEDHGVDQCQQVAASPHRGKVAQKGECPLEAMLIEETLVVALEWVEVPADMMAVRRALAMAPAVVLVVLAELAEHQGLAAEELASQGIPAALPLVAVVAFALRKQLISSKTQLQPPWHQGARTAAAVAT